MDQRHRNGDLSGQALDPHMRVYRRAGSGRIPEFGDDLVILGFVARLADPVF